MPAYIIVRVQVTDWERYREYMKATPAVIERFGGRFVVRGGEMITLEGPQETGRVAMAVIPAMGRNHFFAIYSTIGNVTLGLAPIGWGLLIDVVGARSPVWLGLAWNRYAIFFAAAALAFTVTLALARRLHEPEAASMEGLLREILIQSPQRFWIRFWPRGGT